MGKLDMGEIVEMTAEQGRMVDDGQHQRRLAEAWRRGPALAEALAKDRRGRQRCRQLMARHGGAAALRGAPVDRETVPATAGG